MYHTTVIGQKIIRETKTHTEFDDWVEAVLAWQKECLDCIDQYYKDNLNKFDFCSSQIGDIARRVKGIIEGRVSSTYFYINPDYVIYFDKKYVGDD